MIVEKGQICSRSILDFQNWDKEMNYGSEFRVIFKYLFQGELFIEVQRFWEQIFVVNYRELEELVEIFLFCYFFFRYEFERGGIWNSIMSRGGKYKIV